MHNTNHDKQQQQNNPSDHMGMGLSIEKWRGGGDLNLPHTLIRTDDGALTVSNKDKNVAGKNRHENLLNTESAWDKNSLSQAGVSMALDKDMARESISTIKIARSSGVMLKMVKALVIAKQFNIFC